MAAITFVGLGTEQLGISLLSAIAKQRGHAVNLAFSASLFNDRFNMEIPALAKYFDDRDEVIKAIEKQQPQVLAFSPLTSTYQWSLGVAQQAKQINPEIKTVFGGVHASAVPHLLLQQPAIDFVVVGEGDVAFPKILETIEQKTYGTPIVNTRYCANDGKIITGIQSAFIQDLDSLPFYDKPLWEDHLRMNDLYMTMASRGCPYRCSFCFNNFFANLPEEKSGKYVRLRSPQHMIAELKAAKRRYNMRAVDFEDDVFTTSKKWLKEFLDLYRKEINLPFQMLTHPRFMDDDIAQWLSNAGCRWVQMGVQSMDDNFKKGSLMRYERADDIAVAIDSMNKHGIGVKVDHMFGLPDEPVTAQENARHMYATHVPIRINTFWTSYLPGTDMMNEAIANGRLSQELANKINEGEDFFFFRNTENVKDPELVNLYKAYEFIFRIMPLLPKRLKAAIKPGHVKRIPGFVLAPVALFSDLLNGFITRNPEFETYAQHNLYQLRRWFVRKISGRILKANAIEHDISFTAAFQNYLDSRPASKPEVKPGNPKAEVV